MRTNGILIKKNEVVTTLWINNSNNRSESLGDITWKDVQSVKRSKP